MSDDPSSFRVLAPGTWALFGPIDSPTILDIYQALARSPRREDITWLVSSPGGDATLASGLIHQLRKSRTSLELRVVGEAASAAVDLLLAGTERTAVPSAQFLTHPTTFSGDVTPDNAREAADCLRTADEWILRQLSRRSQKTLRFWRSFFARERFFDAKEALRLGFIDEIL